MNSHTQARHGFTLIELLVVMTLMAVLAALMIGFIPNAASSARESRAGLQLQSWLNIAKQRALRDQAPRGLRLNVAASGVLIRSVTVPNAVVDCQYIEVPDDLPTTAGPMVERVNIPALVGGYNRNNALQIIGLDLQNGYSTDAIDEPYWAVQPGDTIEVAGTGLMYRIRQVGIQPIDPLTRLPAIDPSTGKPFIGRNYIGIQPDLPPWVLQSRPTMNFRIVRAPRPVGDEILKMPADTVIDIATNVRFLNPLPPSDRFATPPRYYDILFAPTGAVISPGLASDKIHLWVRAPNADDGVGGTDPFRGDPTLISIFARTGFVGAFPPAQPPVANPYLLVQ